MTQASAILDSICAWLEHEVQSALPPGQRGIRAQNSIRAHLRGRVIEALHGVVTSTAEQVAREVPSIEMRPQVQDGRVSVLDNEDPCTVCHRPYPVAVVVWEAGKVARVECESCAPEFKRGRRS